jgi:competence protein ComEC
MIGAALSLALGLLASAAAAPVAQKALRIYFVDVEGGQATLLVTPERKSLLIDTGWPGNSGRDADRIVAATKDAGVKRIDFVLITHYHDDHVGGAPQLAAKIPVGTFIDHGENRETSDASASRVFAAYQALLSSGKYNHITAKPGEVLPITGMQVRVVTSDGMLIERPLPGGGKPNASCANAAKPPVDTTENPRSLGTLITFGKLRILDLGDLTADKEMELMCPMNKIGVVDIYIVSHHGWLQSGSAALVHGIAPRVAIMDNGAKKGGSPSAWDVIEKSPGLEDLWQLHYSEEGGAAHNVAAPFLANLQGPDAGNYLKVTASADGSFEVFNSRTRETKKYEARKELTAEDTKKKKPLVVSTRGGACATEIVDVFQDRGDQGFYDGLAFLSSSHSGVAPGAGWGVGTFSCGIAH